MVQRVLFSINHPAQVHLFKHAIWELESRGIDTLVASREKEMTIELLEECDIDHHPLTAAGDGIISLGTELAKREVRLYRLANHFDPDVMVSRLALPAVHVSNVVGCRNIVYTDTVLRPWSVRTVYHGTTLPFSDDVCAPPGFDLQFSCDRRHDIGFQELTYLHPDRFEPDAEKLHRHGIDPDAPYFVLRFSGWDAYHDVGNRGLSGASRWDIVDFLADRGNVHITSEQELPSKYEQFRLTIPPHCIHDLLHCADLYLGDSQTMPTEAALLGTPAIRVNSVAGDDDMHNFEELTEHGLLFSFADEDAALDCVKDIVTSDTAGEWKRKQAALIDQKRDVTAHMVDLILNRDTDTHSASVRDTVEVQSSI